MKIRKYENDVIFEFDTLDELREFDPSYIEDTRSGIIKEIAKQLNCKESEIRELSAYKDDTNEAVGFTFVYGTEAYRYSYGEKAMEKM